MVIQIVEVQGIVVSRRGEILIDRYGDDGEVRFEVEPLGDAGDELVQRDV